METPVKENVNPVNQHVVLAQEDWQATADLAKAIVSVFMRIHFQILMVDA
jgi:hypothetical protein